jgi:hypothetical protein
MSVANMIANVIPAPSSLKTPSKDALFLVRHFGAVNVTLEVGENGREFKIPNRCFEGAINYLQDKGWIKIGALQDSSDEKTFDSYVKNFTSGTSAASYVAPMLEKAGFVEIEKGPPARIRLIEK